MIPLRTMDKYRTIPPHFWQGAGFAGDDECGCFLISHKGARLRIIATSGDGWDHVSVSCPTRCPTWGEMEWVASKFFLPNEAAMQLHVPASDHINNHPYCLHWWRPTDRLIPRPPNIFVGVKEPT